MTFLLMLPRRHRIGFIAMLYLSAVSGVTQTLAFTYLAGSTPAARQAFGRQMDALGRQLTYLYPLPLRVDTLAGYVEWRGLGLLPLAFAFWAVLAGAGGTRGDEERGLVEIWLATGLPRPRFLLARCGAFALAALGVALIASACIELASLVAGSPFAFDRLLALLLVDAVIGVWCYAFTALVAQVAAPARRAAAVAGAILLALYLIDALGRAGGALAPYRGISPFYYVDRTTALAPGGAFDGAATAGLAITAALLAALAVLAFAARDLGAPLVRRARPARPPVLAPDPNPLLRAPILAALYEQRAGLLAWVAGALILCAFLASLAKTVVQTLRDVSGLGGYLAPIEHHANITQAFVGFFVFPVLQLLLAIYAVTAVARWSADDAEGRLELILSAPIRRERVVIERAGALLLGAALLIAAGVLGTALVAAQQGLGVNLADLAGAGAALLPFALSFGAVGAAIAGRSPRLAVPLLSAVAIAGYLLQQIAPLFKWPDWVGNLSPFALYGDPLDNGIFWGGFYVLLALVVAGFGVGALALRRRDVGS